VIGLFASSIINTAQAQSTVIATYNVPGGEYKLTVPVGIPVKVEAWGGGGAGGGGSTTTTLQYSVGGGGGGGGYVFKDGISDGITPVLINVAAGGIGNNAANGGDGGSSSIEWPTGIYFGAYGGKGGFAVVAPPSAYGLGGDGGSYTGGDGGDDGEDGLQPSGDQSVPFSGGHAGGPGGGLGGARQTTNANGFDGEAPGGGGGGSRKTTGTPATASYTGGFGGDGRVMVTMDFPVPVITSTATKFCTGDFVKLEIVSPVTGVEYQWWNSKGVRVGTGNSFNVTEGGIYKATALYTIVYEDGSPVFSPALVTGNKVETDPSNMIDIEEITVDFDDLEFTICSGTTFDFEPVSGTHGDFPTGTEFEWSVSSNAGGITGYNEGSDIDILSLGTLINLTNEQKTIIFYVEAEFDGCADNFLIEVIVDPVAIINTIYPTLSIHSTGVVSPITPVHGVVGNIIPDGTTYSWVGDNPKVDYANDDSNGTGTIDFGVLHNLTNELQTIVFEVTPISGTCSGDPFFITVKVYPIPELKDMDLTICNGEVVILTPQNNPPDYIIPEGTFYTWEVYENNSMVEVKDGVSGSYGQLNLGKLMSTNIDFTAKKIVFKVTPSLADYDDPSIIYKGPDFFITVTINSTISVEIAGENTFCASPETVGGTPAGSIELTANALPVGDYTYAWYLDGAPVATPTTPKIYTVTGLSPRTTPYKYKVIVHSETQECEGISADFEVTVKETPVVKIAADNYDIGLNGTSTVTATVTPNLGTYDYQWWLNGAKTGINQSQLILKDLADGEYEIQAQATPTSGKDGCTGESNYITITVHKTAFTTIYPNESDPVCLGGTIEFKASTSDIPTNVTGELKYEWSLNGVVIPGANLQTLNVNFDKPGEYVYSARITKGDYITEWANKVTVTVLPAPVVTLSSDKTELCSGGTVTFAAFVNPADTGYDYNYDWYVDGTLYNTSIPDYDPQYPYLVMETQPAFVRETPWIVWVVATLRSGQCSGESNKINITIKETPVVKIAADNYDIGLNGTSTVTATVKPNLGTYDYQWWLNGEKTGINQSQLILKDLAEGEYEIQAQATPTSGKDGCTGESNYITITVHKTAFTTIYPNEPDPVCVGGTIEFKASASNIPTNVTGELKYEWSLNGVVIPGANLQTLNATFDKPGEYVYSARITKGDYVTEWANKVTITVLPGAVVTLSSDKTTLCVGDTVLFASFVSPEDTGGDYYYDWYVDGRLINNDDYYVPPIDRENYFLAIPALPEFAREEPWSVWVVVSSQTGGCSGVSEKINIKINNLPTIGVVVDHTDIIVGGKITAVATMAPSDGKYDLVWYLEDSESSSAKIVGYEKEITLTGLEEGDYLLWVKASPTASMAGCVAYSIPIEIHVHGKPKIEINLSEEDITICVGESVEISVTSTDFDEIDGTFTYQWELNGVLIPGATSDAYSQKFPEAGVYKFRVRVEVENGVKVLSEWSDYATITVISTPEVTLSSDKTTLCVGDTVTLAAFISPEDKGGDYLYYWYVDGRLINDDEYYEPPIDPESYFLTIPALPIFAREEPWSVWVVATLKSGGCSGVSNKIDIKINNLPTIGVVVDHTDIIVGGKITALATMVPSDGKYDLIWYLESEDNNSIEIVGYEREITFSVSEDGDYLLWVKASPTASMNGCIAYSIPIEIHVFGKPKINLSLDDITICVGELADVSIVDADFGEIDGDLTFQWELNGILIPGATSDAFRRIFYEAGEYKVRVRVIIDYGEKAMSEWSDYVTITVQELPKVMLIGDNDSYCYSDKVILTANVTPVDGEYEYYWYVDNEFIIKTEENTFISGEDNDLPARSTPYTYQVIARSDAGCEGTSNTFKVKVKALPIVIVTADYQYLGVGGSVTARANVYPEGNYDYGWTVNGVPTGFQKELTLTNLAKGVYKLAVTVIPSDEINGCGVTSPEFTITVVDKPYVIINAAKTTICAGETVNITSNVGINANVDGERSYEWSINGVVVPGAIMSYFSPTLNAPGSYIIDLRVEVDNGQSLKSEWKSNSITITVREAPKVVLLGDNNVYCYGSKVVLTANSTPQGQYVYDWYLDNKRFLTSSVYNTFTSGVDTVLPPRATPYIYHVVARSVQGGCEGISNEFAVTVVQAPEVTIVTDYTDMCPNGVIVAKANVLPAGNYNYIWYLDFFVAGIGPELIISNLPTGRYELYVEVSSSENKNGCKILSDPVSIRVHENPVVTIKADKDSICVGSTVVIKTTNIKLDNIVKDEHLYSYEWAVNGVVIPNAVQSSYSQVLIEPGKYEFSMRVIQNNSFGCASEWSSPAVVFVERIPNISLFVDNDTYCAGSGTLLTAAVIPSGDYIYDWYRDNILVLADGGKTYLSSENSRSSAYIYHVVARSRIGCEGVSNRVSVNVKNAPTVAITTNYTDICPDGKTTAIANVIPTGNYDYVWYRDSIAVGYGRELVIENLPAGEYEIYVDVSTVADYNGCVVSSKPITIRIHEKPVVTVTASSYLICGSGTVTLSTDVALNSAVKDDSKFSYQWAVNGKIIEAATNNTLVQNLIPGEYVYTARVVQDNNLGCASDWSSPVTVVVMSIEVPSFFTSSCDGGNSGNFRTVLLPITINTGWPLIYSVNYTDVTQRALNYSGNILNNAIEIRLPLRAGDYDLEIEINGCRYQTTARVMVDTYALGGANLIEQRWSDVLTVNNNPETNGGFTFYAYQWYKNNVLIPGANKQNYTEPDGVLNGEYFVELHGYAKLAGGNTVEVSYVSCPFKPAPRFNITAYPIPVKTSQSLTLDTSLSGDELKGAVLEIYDTTGLLKRQMTNLSPQMTIDGFSISGIYFGRLITVNSGIHNFRFIVAN